MGLGDYIKAATQRRFEWGVFDCCTFASDWIAVHAGRDPMASVSYSTESEAEALIRDAGGLVELWNRHLIGIAEPCDPCLGAIGVVQLGPQHIIGGIRSDERWIFLTEAGIRAAAIPPDRVLAAWCAHG